MTLAFYRLSSFAFQAGRTRHFGFYAAASLVLTVLTTVLGIVLFQRKDLK